MLKYIIIFIIFTIQIILLNKIYKTNKKTTKQKNKQKLCIIGGGLSGIIATKQLKNKYDVTLFDENKTIGGANHSILYNNKYIDNGVFYLSALKYKNYNIMNILNKYNIEYETIEFSYTILNFSKQIYEKEITQFLQDLESNKDKNITINEILLNYSKGFINNYIIPISTIILACDLNLYVSDFYYLSQMLPFAFDNKPKWIIPKNGTQEIIKKLTQDIKNLVKLNTKIISVKNIKNNKIEIITNNNEIYLFDKLIFCIRFDIINNIYKTPTIKEKEIYSKFKYYEIETIIHTDKTIFKNKNTDYLTYDNTTNILTIIPDFKQNLYISLLRKNSINIIKKNFILDSKKWKHILLSKELVDNRCKLHKLQGHNNVYYSGIEMNNDAISIESSILSGYYISDILGVEYPYTDFQAYVKYLHFKKNLQNTNIISTIICDFLSI
jgi:predicted NAD/FAD-binding protein